MARNVVAACVAALVLSAVTGSGTAINMVSNDLWGVGGVEPRSVYGGVRADAKISKEAVLQTAEGQPLAPVAGVLAVIDLPISFVCDTLTLPFVFYLQAHKDASADARPKAAPVEQAKYTDPPAKPAP